jgi:deoxyribodipyrimidine photolyase-related protein
MAHGKILRLVLGDQLNERHSWFRNRAEGIVYLLMEVRQETDYVTHHIQKVAAFFAAMRAFAAGLREMGHDVIYIRLDDPANRQTFEGNIVQLIEKHRFQKFEYLMPDEFRLDAEFREMAAILPVPSAVFDTEHFLTRRADVAQFFAGKKQYLMETFYRHMRKTHDILLEGGTPVGGKWNYDARNRMRYDGKSPIPPPLFFNNDVTDIVAMLNRMEVRTFGALTPDALVWPVTRTQALNVLRHFLARCLPHFGTYEDAMTEESRTLFHSRLSFALNTKMLSPGEVIDAALDEWNTRPREIAIQEVEGFIRQILGWREYMRGMYWMLMPEFKTMNFFNHTAKLPHYFWDAETRMNCLRKALSQSLDQAYAHHIQRLMITGNFALLAGIHPDYVDEWYLGVYIDAVEWVEITNTRGMSQFADGGIIATKPYVSSARYIHTMSDYCEHCRYDRTLRHGAHACPFNSLYWGFLRRHRAKLAKIPRMGIMYGTLDRMAAGERDKTLRQADRYREDLEVL